MRVMYCHAIMFYFFCVALFPFNCSASYLEQANQAKAEGNFPLAIELIHKAADIEKDNKARSILGGLYLTGQLVDKNVDRGIAYFNQAIEGNETEAMHELAVAYLQGHHIRKNRQKALELWERAFSLGDATAGYNIASAYWPDNKDVNESDSDWKVHNKWLLKAAKAGSLEAQYLIGFEMLGEDWHLDTWDTNKKIREAFKWLKLAEANGHSKANGLVMFMRKQYDMPQHVYDDAESFVRLMKNKQK